MLAKFKIKHNLYITALLIILLSSCQSSIRFSSQRTESRSKSLADRKTATEEQIRIKKIKPSDRINSGLSKQQSDLLSEAELWLGVPYCWGGVNNNCVDCSGFVKQVFEKINIFLPRTAAEQYAFSDKVFFENRKIGDLVFFKSKNKINHVGIYIGGEEFVHSASSIGVSVQSLNDDYFKRSFVGYGRVLKK